MINLKTFSFYMKGVKCCPTAKDRYDVKYKSGNYELFETRLLNKTKFNINGLSFYITKNSKWNPNSKRQPKLKMGKNGHISGVFIPESCPSLGYGDIKDSPDALIFIFSNDGHTVEVLMGTGLSDGIKELYAQVKNGTHNVEIESLRSSIEYVFRDKGTNLVTNSQS